MGHVARILEAAGIATVIIATRVFEKRMRMMALPRVLLTPYLMGRPVGPPGNKDAQRASVLAALALLDNAQQVGTVENLP
ncbi:MAG: hypothetical protein GY697_07020 [Desulfobacterales bacterium]|nr:hypothetical protein [Desulfobacterales bacterium]